MFNFSEWLISGITNGYASGNISFVRVTEMTAAYLNKGFISAEQAEQIAIACPAPVITEETAEEPITETEETVNE